VPIVYFSASGAQCGTDYFRLRTPFWEVSLKRLVLHRHCGIVPPGWKKLKGKDVVPDEYYRCIRNSFHSVAIIVLQISRKVLYCSYSILL